MTLRFLSVFLNLKICSDSKEKSPERLVIVHTGLKTKTEKKKTDFSHHAIPDCQIS